MFNYTSKGFTKKNVFTFLTVELEIIKETDLIFVYAELGNFA